MKERNLCHESGCPDLCCINKWNRFSPQELKDIFPDAIRLEWGEKVDWLDVGVYVLGDKGRDGRHRVFTKGRCPNNVDGCIADPKPEFCKGQPFAGERCNKFRKKGGLPQISLDSQEEIVYLSPKKSLVEKLLVRK